VAECFVLQYSSVRGMRGLRRPTGAHGAIRELFRPNGIHGGRLAGELRIGRCAYCGARGLVARSDACYGSHEGLRHNGSMGQPAERAERVTMSSGSKA